MLIGVEKEKSYRRTDQKFKWTAEHVATGSVYNREYSESQIDGIHIIKQYEGLKTAVDAQKQAIKKVDLDKIDDLRDEMLDMKMQSDLMN